MQKLQHDVHSFMESMGWHYWDALGIIGRLGEENGELSRELNHQYGEKQKRDDENEGSVEMEIGDIVYTLACLANSLTFTLPTCTQNHLPHEENGGRSSLSLFAAVMKYAGLLAGAVDEYNRSGWDPICRYSVQTNIDSVCYAVYWLARKEGYELQKALDKSIAKYGTRDKGRFSKKV